MKQFDATQAASLANLTRWAYEIYLGGGVTPVALAKAGYAVLYSIYATHITERLVYGYIASGPVPGEYYIAIRGTETIGEWLRNVEAIPFPFPGGGFVHAGFLRIWERLECVTFGGEVVTMREAVASLPGLKHVIVTGHSLGAALATLVAADLATVHPGQVELLTFASPRVGELFFRNRIDHEVLHHRVANYFDAVRHLPALPFVHCGDAHYLGPTDVTTPSATRWWDALIQHDMRTYQWMLDPDAYTLPPEFAR